MRQLLVVAALCASMQVFAQAQQPVAVPPAVAPAIPAPLAQPQPANRWTPAQIREAFQLADANSDGRLTRGEAQRLAIMPRSFEDTDLNKDGVVSLEEYLASFPAQ